MSRNKIIWVILIVLFCGLGTNLIWSSVVYASAEGGEHDDHDNHEEDEHGDEHGDGHHDDHGDEAPADSTIISQESANAAGIVMSEAGPKIINKTIPLFGRITLDQNKMALVKARFAGVVRSINKAQGETVKKGDVLATVESNESLQVYNVISPISGVILARNSNVGDVADSEPLFTVADISSLWAELHVFSQDVDKVKQGAKLTVSSSECEDIQQAELMALLPITEASTQTLLARAAIKNIDSHWSPGMSVQANVVIATEEAEVAIKTSAIQRMEGKTVVFVLEDKALVMKPITVGLSDDTWSEVLSGLNAGQQYVSEGSFTVKADIGKNGAAHEH